VFIFVLDVNIFVKFLYSAVPLRFIYMSD